MAASNQSLPHGVHVSMKGYLRYSSAPHRHKYVHRVLMSEMCREFCFYELGDDGLPYGFTVEHIDHNRQHNCTGNLLLLEKVIHDAISWHSWKSY